MPALSLLHTSSLYDRAKRLNSAFSPPSLIPKCGRKLVALAGSACTGYSTLVAIFSLLFVRQTPRDYPTATAISKLNPKVIGKKNAPPAPPPMEGFLRRAPAPPAAPASLGSRRALLSTLT